MKPKISIITVVFNGEPYIDACIQSVAHQKYPNKEHLIVDGLSKDRTVAIAETYTEKHDHLVISSEKDTGIYDAMNKGIALATGDYIYFLGVDDILIDDKVLDDFFGEASDEQYDLLVGGIKKIPSNKNSFFDGKIANVVADNISHQGMFLHKSVYERIGNFDLKYKYLADWQHNIRWAAIEGLKVKCLPRLIAEFREVGASYLYFDEPFFEDRPALIKKLFSLIETDELYIRSTISTARYYFNSKRYKKSYQAFNHLSQATGKNYYQFMYFREWKKKVVHFFFPTTLDKALAKAQREQKNA